MNHFELGGNLSGFQVLESIVVWVLSSGKAGFSNLVISLGGKMDFTLCVLSYLTPAI